MLKRRVGEISMVNLDRIPHDRAGFGSTVQLRDEGGELIVYQLVMPEEANAEKGFDLDVVPDRTGHPEQRGRRRDQGRHTEWQADVRAHPGVTTIHEEAG